MERFGMLSRLAVFLFGALPLLAASPAATSSATSSITSPNRLPPPPGNLVTTVTPHPGYFTEPSVAVNPRNPQQVVAAFQSSARLAYSRDAGKTWNLAQGVTPTDYRVSGDVSVAFDSEGHAILCYIAFDKLGTFNYWGHGATRNGIFIRRSLDGGKTWESRAIPVVAQPTAPGIPFEDKPYIVAAPGQGNHPGNLYVGWTRWSLTDSKMLLSRSTDDGETWSAPREIDQHPGLPRDDNGSLEGFDGTVGPDGTLYAVWSNRDGIVLTASHDDGQTFTPAHLVISTAPTVFAVDGVDRANGFPQIAIDPRSGPHGRLYVTWTDYRNGDLDIFCASSNDGGRTWTSAARVNNDPLHNGADQYFQWLAADPIDGSVNVIFYDRRYDPRNRTQIVVLARSVNGGHSFENYAWTSQPFDPGGAFIGDYNGIAALGGSVFGAWTVQPPFKKAQAKEGAEGKNASEAPPRSTIIQVGSAHFAR